MKKIISLIIISLFLIACSKTKENEYFKLNDINPLIKEKENFIELNYNITNNETKDLTFKITIDNKNETYPIKANKNQDIKIILDIGKPNNYDLEYKVLYEVYEQEKIIWKDESTIKYNCKNMFNHKAKVTYLDEEKEIELIDYEDNYFKIQDLFPTFDPNKNHNVKIKNPDKDIASIEESKDSKNKSNSSAIGNILRLSTLKSDNPYHFSDNLEIEITDTLTAKSINWQDYMTFSKDADTKTSNIAGMKVTTFKTKVIVENPSDETIYGTVKHFYVNDKLVSDEYLAGSKHDMISPHSKEEIYNISSGSVWLTTKEKEVKKFGMKIFLEDKDGNVLYNDIQWLHLD